MRGRLYSGSDFDDNRSNVSRGDDYMDASSPSLFNGSAVSTKSKDRAFKSSLVSKLGGTNDDGFDSLLEHDEQYHQKAKIILR